jgi:hypothetical protein
LGTARSWILPSAPGVVSPSSESRARRCVGVAASGARADVTLVASIQSLSLSLSLSLFAVLAFATLSRLRSCVGAFMPVCVHHVCDDARLSSLTSGRDSRFCMRHVAARSLSFSCSESSFWRTKKTRDCATFRCTSEFSHYVGRVREAFTSSAPLSFAETLRLDAELVRLSRGGGVGAARAWPRARDIGGVRRAVRAWFFVVRGVRARALRAHGALGGRHSSALAQARISAENA